METIEATEAVFPALLELTKKDGDFAALKFAAQGVSKDDRRKALWNICIHKGFAIGTSGRILNMAPLAGTLPYSEEHILYQVLKHTKTILTLSLCTDQNHCFPAYESIATIPKENRLGEFNPGEHSPSMAFCKILNAADETAFDFELFKLMAPREPVTAYQASNEGPLFLSAQESGFLGVLMPLRLS